MQKNSILQNIKEGELDALDNIYRENKEAFILWFAKTYRVSAGEILDIYHFTLIKFYENIKAGKITTLTSSIRTYLFGIGKNLMSTHLNLRKRVDYNMDMLLHHPVESDLEQKKEKEQRFAIMEAAFNKLSTNCQELIRKFYYNGMSYAEIREISQYQTAQTAKKEKYRCIKRLRELCAA